MAPFSSCSIRKGREAAPATSFSDRGSMIKQRFNNWQVGLDGFINNGSCGWKWSKNWSKEGGVCLSCGGFWNGSVILREASGVDRNRRQRAEHVRPQMDSGSLLPEPNLPTRSRPLQAHRHFRRRPRWARYVGSVTL